MRRGFALLVLAHLVGLLALPVASAFPTPASPVEERWQELFMLVFWVAVVVAVVVYGALLYALFRFRARKGGPKEGPHIHGNTRMEIAWTIAPTVVMGWLLVISYQGLFIVDYHPGEETDFVVQVSASQFKFDFTYPDGTTGSPDLHVEQNQVVGLEVTSTDVIHAFSIHGLGVMIDAVPGRTNEFWFKATIPGDYPIRCRELCGVGHSYMLGTAHIFPEGSRLANVTDAATGENRTEVLHWGPPRVEEAPPAAQPPPTTNVTVPPGAKEIEVTLGPGLVISQIGDIALNEQVAFKVTNADPSLPHDFYVGVYAKGSENNGAEWFTKTLTPGGGSEVLLANFTKDLTYTYWCNQAGHYPPMGGKFDAGKGGGGGGGKKPLLPGFEMPLLLAALIVAGFVASRRSK